MDSILIELSDDIIFCVILNWRKKWLRKKWSFSCFFGCKKGKKKKNFNHNKQNISRFFLQSFSIRTKTVFIVLSNTTIYQLLFFWKKSTASLKSWLLLTFVSKFLWSLWRRKIKKKVFLFFTFDKSFFYFWFSIKKK